MKLFTVASLAYAYVMRGISGWIPRDRRLWVFLGWHRTHGGEAFADNSKYLFLEAAQTKNIRAIWLSDGPELARTLRARGYEAYDERSLRGAWFALRAGTTVLDAYPRRRTWRRSCGSRAIQLWHGKGLKEVRITPSLRSPESGMRYDYSIATSPFTARLMAQSVPVAPERVLVTGLPRNDALLKKIDNADIDGNPEMERILGSASTSRVVLYAPTFRRWENDPLAAFERERMEAFAREHGFVFVLSLHPKYHAQTRAFQSEYLRFIPGGYDLYPFLNRFDALITDYSSLFADYLLLDRPILFFAYDLEQYQGAGSFAIPYEAHTPGPICRTADEVRASLLDAFAHDSAKELRARLRAQYHTYVDGNASERVMRALT